jgi:hypothetical protein
VLRRCSPSHYYAALYDSERVALSIVRRDGAALDELASTPVPVASSPITLSLQVLGTAPTQLEAELVDALGLAWRASARDATPVLQREGDPGVLASARTLFPSAGPPVFPALGNLHLLPYAVQEGQAVLQTPVGEAVIGAIRERSTVAFREISVRPSARVRATAASIVAATTGPPVAGGARLHVALDVPGRVSIELSRRRDFRGSRLLPARRTDRFDAVIQAVGGFAPGERVHWRARAVRGGRSSVGPARSFRVLPRRNTEGAVRIAVCSCGTQFGPIFDHLAAARPDVVVWQGDLNYPDTHGPLAQTRSGYAGIWRDFLANPRLAPVLERAAFAAQRDDHDYGVQDANAATIPDWGRGPWDSLMGDRPYYRFAAGLLEVWVLDQRLFKSDPEAADGPGKTLLGGRQRRWLLRTLASSPAPFKLICSPCTIFMPGNGRDGSWAEGFDTEREWLLGAIERRVSGHVAFVTGDTHLTGVYEGDGQFEARPAPLDIPLPNDITLINPAAAADLRAEPGVAYASDRGHFALAQVGPGRRPELSLSLVREDGEVVFDRRFAR